MMEPLPNTSANLRELVEADLRRAARLIIKIQDVIDWQWRFATPEGDYHLSVTMPDDLRERRMMLRRIKTFMIWKRASGYVAATEMIDPDAVSAVGVDQREAVACIALIRRKPKPWTAANFGLVEWLPSASIDAEFTALLPKGPRAMTPKG